MALVNARQGVLGQVVKIKEDVYDADPTTPVPVIVPLSDAETLANTQPLTASRIGDGRRTSKGSWLGMIDDSGDIPTSMDYKYMGHDFICHLGSVDASGNPIYTRVTSGSNSLHKWTGWGVPISFQIEKRHTQPTAIYHRHKGMFSTVMAFRPAAAGQAAYTVTHLGVGDFVRTASSGTTVDYAPFTANNYFNGFCKLNGGELADVIAFNLSLNSNVTRKDAYFHQGMAAAVNFGIPQATGTLGRIFSVDYGDTFLDLALNETISELEIMYANRPLTAGPTAWCRIILPAVKFSRRDPNIRLDDSEDQSLDFQSEVASAARAAEVIGTTVGSGSTYTFTVAASTTIVVSIAGGADITVPALSPTGSRTLASIVTEINGYAPFATVATASAWNGHLMIAGDAAGASVQFKAGGATANTLFGFDTTLHSGTAATDLIVELYNQKLTDY